MNESANYDESKVGNHPLPELLQCEDGTKVIDSSVWITKRRPEILDLFATYVYGKFPPAESEITCEEISVNQAALDGRAIRHEIAINYFSNAKKLTINLALYLPKSASTPVPTFLGSNFNGNHAVDYDESISINTKWMRNTLDEKSVVNNRATESSRGFEASRWPLELIIEKGFGVATFYYGDLEADHPDGWKNGIRAVLSPDGESSEFENDDWGAISAWSWGLSRALDYLVTNPAVDSKRVALIGHSRLGKAALWAGALDERFALVISNNSGAGGISLARRDFGESIRSINENFPHWFCGNYKRFNDSPETLPVDMHQLAALIAPRPLYIASAQEDAWADPRGEFLAGKNAEPVYALFGKPGLGVAEWPPVNQPVGEFIGYHIRTGKHDVTTYDWQQFLRFASLHFRITQ
jgi:hypothetical protein